MVQLRSTLPRNALIIISHRMGKCMKCGCITYVWNPISTVVGKFDRNNRKFREVSVAFIVDHCEATGLNPQQTTCMCGHDVTMHTLSN